MRKLRAHVRYLMHSLAFAAAGALCFDYAFKSDRFGLLWFIAGFAFLLDFLSVKSPFEK